MEELLSHKLDALADDVTEIKSDVRDIKDGAPLYRINELEKWRTNVNKFLAGGAIAVVGQWAAVLLTS